jgi:hypothetical protein
MNRKRNRNTRMVALDTTNFNGQLVATSGEAVTLTVADYPSLSSIRTVSADYASVSVVVKNGDNILKEVIFAGRYSHRMGSFRKLN